MAYLITPGASAVVQNVPTFTNSLSACTLKYTLSTPNATAMGLIRAAGAIEISTSPSLVFTESGPQIKLTWSPTVDHTLVGNKVITPHVFTLETTLKDYPSMDSILKKTVTFKVTVTSVCESTAITTSPIQNMAYLIQPDAITQTGVITQTFTPWTEPYGICGLITYTKKLISH
jgi:hypothetical protein